MKGTALQWARTAKFRTVCGMRAYAAVKPREYRHRSSSSTTPGCRLKKRLTVALAESKERNCAHETSTRGRRSVPKWITSCRPAANRSKIMKQHRLQLIFVCACACVLCAQMCASVHVTWFAFDETHNSTVLTRNSLSLSHITGLIKRQLKSVCTLKSTKLLLNLQ